MSSFSVVATVRAPKHHVEKFVRYYKTLGADRVYIFYDDPSFYLPLNVPGIKEVVCNDEYWHGRRPSSIEERQRKNTGYAVRWSSSEWLLHCDLDELLYYPGNVKELLRSVPSNVASIIAKPIEAVYAHEPSQKGVFDTTYYKKPMAVVRGYHAAVWACYGDLTRLTNGGFWGHIRGKSLFRAAYCKGNLPIHRWLESPTSDADLVVNYEFPRLNLLHFETMTFVDWKIKHIRRLNAAVLAADMGERRREQVAVIRRTQERWGEWGLHDLYRRMTILEEDRMEPAIAAGFVTQIEGVPVTVARASAARHENSTDLPA